MALMFRTAQLFTSQDLPDELAALLETDWPWEVLARLDAFRVEDRREGVVHPSAVVDGPLFMAVGSSVGPHAYLEGPIWLGPGATVKHGAYVRGPVILAAGAEVGAKSEVKRSFFLPKAKAAHLNYVGDSVLGAGVNLGAGVKIANFKTFGTTITVAGMDTGLRKFGAAIGDGTALGCNAVTSPGTLIGPDAVVYNGALLRGVIPAHTVVKVRQSLELSPRQ